MFIDPISSVGGVTVPSVAAYAAETHTTPAHAELVLTEKKQSESVEERANDGDPAALTQLAENEKQAIPIDSQQLQPPAIEPEPAGHAPGKGILIDVYK
jgi:hypothetical protein